MHLLIQYLHILITTIGTGIVVILLRKQLHLTLNQNYQILAFFRKAHQTANTGQLFALTYKNKSEKLLKEMLKRVCFKGTLETAAVKHIAQIVDLESLLLKIQNAQATVILLRSSALYAFLAVVSLALQTDKFSRLSHSNLISAFLFLLYTVSITFSTVRSQLTSVGIINFKFLRCRFNKRCPLSIHFLKLAYFLTDASRWKNAYFNPSIEYLNGRNHLVEQSLEEWGRLRRNEFKKYEQKVSLYDITLLFPALLFVAIDLAPI